MVKIKDFTLASKNLGGGTCPPCPTHLPPCNTLVACKLLFIYSSGISHIWYHILYYVYIIYYVSNFVCLSFIQYYYLVLSIRFIASGKADQVINCLDLSYSVSRGSHFSTHDTSVKKTLWPYFCDTFGSLIQNDLCKVENNILIIMLWHFWVSKFVIQIDTIRWIWFH